MIRPPLYVEFEVMTSENVLHLNHPGTPGHGGNQTLRTPSGFEPVREISAAAAQLMPPVRTVSYGRALGRRTCIQGGTALVVRSGHQAKQSGGNHHAYY